jgi:preprotein translocase SecE subunit
MERQGAMTDDPELQPDPFEIGDVRPAARAAKPPVRSRTNPLQFAREIREELRQVAWPNRTEMVNYSMVVFFTLVIMISLIFLLNYVFGKGVFFMFQK